MSDLISQLESYVHSLRTALQQGDSAQIDRDCQNFENILLQNQDYRFIGDERLLAQIEILLSQAFGEVADAELEGFREHLTNLHKIHDNLYAVLNPDNDLDMLLIEQLGNWPGFSAPLGVNFKDSIKNDLHRTRTTGDSEQRLKAFFDLYITALREQSFLDAASIIEAHVKQAIDGYKRLRKWQIYALFASGSVGDVYGIKVDSLPNGTGNIRSINSVGMEMQTAANKIVAYINRVLPYTRNWDFRWEIGRSDIPYDGASIGLGLTLAALSGVENIDIDSYTAFTGQVDWDSTGAVRHIEHLDAKLLAAHRMGIRRVFIPQENADAYSAIDGLKVIPVESIEDVKNKLRSATYLQASTSSERHTENKIQLLIVELQGQNIRKVKQTSLPNSSCIRVEFTNGKDTVPVMIYYAQQITPNVQGKDTPLKHAVQLACNKIFGERIKVAKSSTTPAKQETRTYKVHEESTQRKLEQHLLHRGDSVRETEANCIYRIKVTKGGQVVYVRQFKNGTLTVAGIVPLLDEVDADVKVLIGYSDIQFSQDGEPNRLDTQIAAVKAIELGDRWIGTDEAGKGDYFGPLVAAAVLVDEKLAGKLEEIGVKDSKSLSDKRNQELAETIRNICGKRAQVVLIPPERFNSLTESFSREGKNLNTLLAWAHTRALEDILTEFPQQQIMVIVDKFADERYIKDKLLSKSRQTNLNLIQLPKAEANIAVAAASILARASFLQFLTRMSEQYKLEFPKGASDPRIIQIGKTIISRFGRDELNKVAKTSFRTTYKITE